MKLFSLFFAFSNGCLPSDSASERQNLQNLVRNGKSPNKFGMGEKEAHPMQRAIGEELMENFTTGVLKCLREKKRSPLRAKQQEAMMSSQWAKDWQSHCGSVVDPFCPAEIGECWAMAVLVCRESCDAKFELRGNRKKFKRCIYKELKIYEREYPQTVKQECTVKGTYY